MDLQVLRIRDLKNVKKYVRYEEYLPGHVSMRLFVLLKSLCSFVYNWDKLYKYVFHYDQHIPVEIEDIPPKGSAVIAIFVSFFLLYHGEMYEVMDRIEPNFIYTF